MAHPFLQLADFIATEKHRRKSEKLRAGELDIARKRLEDIKRVHAAQYGEEVPVTPGPKDVGFTATRFKPGLEQQKLGLREQELEISAAKIPWHEKPLNKKNWAITKALFAKSKLDKAVNPFFNLIDDLIDQNATRQDAYVALSANLDNLKTETNENLQNELNKAIKSGSKSQIAKITDAIELINDPNLLDRFFPGVKESLFGKAKTEKPSSSLGKLIDDMNKLPEGDPRREWYRKAIQKAISQEKQGKLTDTEKESIRQRREIASDIQSLSQRIAGLQSGENVVTEALASGRPEAISDLQSQLKTMVDHYKKLGGNIERLGFKEEQGQIKAKYDSPKAVKKAFKEGKLTEEEATQILINQF